MATTPAPSNHVPKRKKRQSSLLAIFLSQGQLDRVNQEHTRKRTSSVFYPQPSAPKAPAPDPAAKSPSPAAAAPAATPPKTPPPAASPKTEEAPKQTEEAKAAEPPAAKGPFTAIEDVALLSLKGQNKTWAEIGEVLVGREKDELLARHKEIQPAENTGPAAAPSPAQANTGKAKTGKQKTEVGKKGNQKGKGNNQSEKKDEPPVMAPAVEQPAPTPAPATAPQEAKPEAFHTPLGAWPVPTVKPAEPFVAHNEALVVGGDDFKIKSLLKRGIEGGFHCEKLSVPEGATMLDECPIIYVDEFDPLEISDLSFLYNMKCAYDERKWGYMASKLFDYTGKRIDPEWIREKLKNCN